MQLSIVYRSRDRLADEGMIANYESLLRSKDIPYQLVTFDGGHWMDRDTLRALATAE